MTHRGRTAGHEWTAVRLSHERRPNEEDAAASDLGSTSRNFPSFSRETVGETFSAMKIAAIEVAGVAMRGGVGVVGDEERAILDALNALRHRYTYVFTTGGIGPTHGDITADCVAKAFGVPIDTDPRALAILHEWVKTTGAEMNEARLRMTRIPKGAELILNKVSGAPGFWIGNVIVMAGVPSIMQAMLDEVAPKLKSSVRTLTETVRADAREGDFGM